MKKYTHIIFDLDGTLAVSKSALDSKMAELLSDASHTLGLAIITGGMLSQIQIQCLDQLTENAQLQNMYVLPTSGSQMYVFNPDGQTWESLYNKAFTQDQKDRVMIALHRALGQASFTIDQASLRGEQIEDRGSQITFSALGQKQFPEVKVLWDPDHVKRLELLEYLEDLQDEFDVKMGGSTSIDITLKGVDKEFGIHQFYKHTDFDIHDGLFVGDQIVPGGNDWAATQTGIETRSTSGPEETMSIIKEVLAPYNML